jgi:hypothetical protein
MPKENQASEIPPKLDRCSLKKRLKEVLFATAAGFFLLPWAIKNWAYVRCLDFYVDRIAEHPIVACNGGYYHYEN